MIQITTEKATLLIVDLPEGAEILGIEESSIFWKAEFMGFKDVTTFRDLPEGEWEIIGKTFQLTEEQCKTITGEVVDKYETFEAFFGWKDYAVDYIRVLTSAKESFRSLLEANEIYQTNPRQQDWDELCTFGYGSKMTLEDYKNAQSRTMPNSVILKKI